MGAFDTIKKTIADLPVSDIIRERLSLSFDRLADAETKIGELQIQVGGVTAALERERLDHKQAREELQRLKDEHTEEIRIHKLVEFHRGKRTGGKWMAFCPKCRMPATDFLYGGKWTIYCSANCGWRINPTSNLDAIAKEI